jgi:Uma2 family endonuclease
MNAFAPPPARFSSADFQRLLKSGAFKDMRVELREGKIVKMSPQYYKHGKAKRLLSEALQRAIIQGQQVFLVEQGISVAFSEDFQPLPDVIVWDPSLVSAEPDGPIPGSSVKLIVEVADTSLADDLGAKRAAYARAGLSEYWVADLSGRRIVRFSAPVGPDYSETASYAFGQPVPALGQSLIETAALV